MPRIKGGKLPDIFATRDEDIHRRMRRPVARLFSVTNLATFEPAMTSTMKHFFSRLDELFANKDTDFDLFQWVQFFMFDVLGEVTFSRELGCLEKGKDVDGIMANIWAYFRQVAAVGVYLIFIQLEYCC
jgi:cytochrome P450